VFEVDNNERKKEKKQSKRSNAFTIRSERPECGAPNNVRFRFVFPDRSFLVANAQQAGCNIIYCSDGFCHMTGYSRAEVMQRPAICEFLQGPMTSQHAVSVVKEALAAGMERHFEILYYRKDGKSIVLSVALSG